MNDSSGMVEFLGIGELAETTTHLLSLNLQSGTRSPGRKRANLDQVEHMVLRQASDYLHKVREGFVFSVRTSQVVQTGEIRFLLSRVLTDWAQLSRELGLEDVVGAAPGVEEVSGDPDQVAEQRVQHIRHELLAFSMAVVALGYLPRLPSKQVTFPHSYSDPPTYVDIPVPSTPGEMLWRIEELEATIWQMMANDMQELVLHRYGPLRRTYGFFETSAWLARKRRNGSA